MRKSSIAVVVLNWNDADLIPKSVGSLLKQSEKCDVIVVDNESEDNSRAVIESFGDRVTALWNTKNEGFAGGVNTGIRYALSEGYKFIALLNNDAVADKNWVENLRKGFTNAKVGAVTCSLVHEDQEHYDSIGDLYTAWGLPYPRGRGEKVQGQYDKELVVASVSGGASMFRAEFFQDVGLFDEDFFAYYEDVDLGLRGNLRGWQLKFVPKAVAYHATGSTSGRVKGFTTYQTMKNLPWVYAKNVPFSLLFSVGIRLGLAYVGFFLSAAARGQLRYALKGSFWSILKMPRKILQRRHIQSTKKLSSADFQKLLTNDLPPNADKLRAARTRYWKFIGRQ